MSELDQPFWRSCLGAFVSAIVALAFSAPAFGMEAGVHECFAREGKTSIINKKHRSDYERKLFLTPDEMARYVFLTNRRDDGDRSAAVYRAQRKKKSLPGNYWVTATFA